jgi:uncharacterized repeat protein (TIGR03803 family)
VFSITASGQETVLRRFKNDSNGGYPKAGLSVIDGKLFGTTSEGGACEFCGTVYSIDASNDFKTVYSFTGMPSGGPESTLVKVGDTIYGTATGLGNYDSCGIIFSLDSTAKEKTEWSFCNSEDDGRTPSGNLVVRHNVLYGTTEQGGAGCSRHHGCGTIFAFDLRSGLEQAIHLFKSTDGTKPTGLALFGNTLYGTTFEDGSPGKGPGFGTVYTVTL